MFNIRTGKRVMVLESESVALLCDTSTYRTLYQSGGNAVHYAAKSQPCHKYAGAGA